VKQKTKKVKPGSAAHQEEVYKFEQHQRDQVKSRKRVLAKMKIDSTWKANNPNFESESTKADSAGVRMDRRIKRQSKLKPPKNTTKAVKPWERYKRKMKANAKASREKLKKVQSEKKKAAYSKLKTSMKKRAAAKKEKTRLAGPKKARTKTAKGPILTTGRKKHKSRMAKSLAKRRRLSKTLGLGKNVAARKKITQRRRKQQQTRDRYKN